MSSDLSAKRSLSAYQCRAARAGLRLTVAELAAASGVGRATIERFERQELQPQTATITRLVAYFEGRSIRFVDEPGAIGPEPTGDG